MCELLVKAIDAVHSDADIDRSGCYKKGDIVIVKPDNWIWGGKEGMPSFIIIRVPGVTVAAAENYMGEWKRMVAITVLSSNPANGTYQVQVSCYNPGASGVANLTRQDVESYLTNSNATLDSVAANQIIFTFNLWQTLKSDWFWDADVSLVGFTLVSYDDATGETILDINISGVLAQWSPQIIASRIEAKGGAVISYTEPVCRMMINRSNVFSAFRNDLREKLERIFYKRQYYIASADVDTVIAAGGEISLTAVQFTSRINNKLDI